MRRLETEDHSHLLRLHGDAVWRLIVRILCDEGHDAADCFQQAYVELVARLRRDEEVLHAAALLKRIAAARAIDVVRRRIRDRKRIDDIDARTIPARHSSAAEAQAEGSELLAALRVALTELPVRHAAAFVLTQIEDLSHAEAARALGVTRVHLSVLLRRARVALCKRLDAHNPREKAPT
jgi:RNA polymerase sigma-70 factor (ECF subfamily)